MSGKTAKRERSKRDMVVDAFMRAFMTELRVIFKRNAKEKYQRFPGMATPCSTCAFNESTDSWKGWDATAWGLMRAIDQDRPFYCHHKKSGEEWPTVRGEYALDPTSKDLRACGGWLVVVGEPDAKTAQIRAAMKMHQQEVLS